MARPGQTRARARPGSKDNPAPGTGELTPAWEPPARPPWPGGMSGPKRWSHTPTPAHLQLAFAAGGTH
eukprot:5313440-Lingulodinium_polyedra.AAC.1